MIKFYIISTIISFIVFIVSALAARDEIINEGYKKKNKKRSLWGTLQGVIVMSIPFLNIIIAVTALFDKKTTKESLIEEYEKL